MCYKCNVDVGDDDFGECDDCNNFFHIKCVGATKTELKARKNSKCLRIYCPECILKKDSGTLEKLKEILGVLYKLDLHNQQQNANNIADIPKIIESKLDTFVSSFSSMAESSKSLNGNKRNAQSYADALKRNVKPAVVIKPKTNQHSTKTFEDISKNVEKSEVNVCSTRNIRDGGVVLRCENATETLKVKQIINDKLGDRYEILLPTVKRPRLRVTNIDADIPNDKILDQMIHHNIELTYADMRLITVINRKRNKYKYNDIIVEMKSDIYKKVLDQGKLKLPWRECRVFEHLHLKRCYKCCGFNHKSDECKNNQTCSKCAGINHKFSECKKNNQCCINCKTANEKFNMKLDTKHHAFSRECTVFKRRILRLVNKIEYNENE